MSAIKAALITRERDLWLDQVAKLGGRVKPGKIQPSSIRAFRKVTTERNFQLNFNNQKLNISEAENLMNDYRLAQIYALGVGLCKVPLIAGVPQWAVAKFISNPFDSELTANEQKAANAFFNARLTLHTQQEDRFDQVLASRYMAASTDEATYCIKTLPLNANYLMVGGEENYLEFRLPPTGDFTTDLLSPTTYAFYVVAQCEAILIAADEAATAQNVAAFLRG